MTQVFKKFYTPLEYLELEEIAQHKSEYYRGQIYAIAGTKINHNRIARNICNALTQALVNHPCETFIGDIKIWVEAIDLYTYPDVMVIRGEPTFARGREDILTNPQVIIEVVSDSTRKYDSTDKFEFYKNLKSFQNYILIEQDSAYIQSFQRFDKRKWLLESFKGLDDILKIPTLEIEIPLSQIYARVKWPEKPETSLKPEA